MKYFDFPTLPRNAFIKINGRLATLEGGKDSGPPPPDYTGAAQATAAGNVEAARVGANANRVNQYGPYGSIEYAPIAGSDINPATGEKDPNFQRYSVTTTLSPQQQAILNQTQGTNLSLAQLANQGVNQAQGVLSNPNIDMSKVAASPINAGTTAQEAILARLQPQLDQSRNALNVRLANQGIMQGSEAYDNAMRTQGQQENDLRSQAALQGINLDTAAHQQGLQEQAYLQDRPLNLINALRTGAQVQLPQQLATPQQATASGANYLGAAQAQGAANQNAYNNQVAQQNALTSGLFNLGSSALGAWGG